MRKKWGEGCLWRKRRDWIILIMSPFKEAYSLKYLRKSESDLIKLVALWLCALSRLLMQSSPQIISRWEVLHPCPQGGKNYMLRGVLVWGSFLLHSRKTICYRMFHRECSMLQHCSWKHPGTFQMRDVGKPLALPWGHFFKPEEKKFNRSCLALLRGGNWEYIVRVTKGGMHETEKGK